MKASRNENRFPTIEIRFAKKPALISLPTNNLYVKISIKLFPDYGGYLVFATFWQTGLRSSNFLTLWEGHYCIALHTSNQWHQLIPWELLKKHYRSSLVTSTSKSLSKRGLLQIKPNSDVNRHNYLLIKLGEITKV